LSTRRRSNACVEFAMAARQRRAQETGGGKTETYLGLAAAS
jgi:hypothetical protein